MRRMMVTFLTLSAGAALGAVGSRLASAAPQAIQRTDVLNADMAGMDGKVAHMWIAEVAPGASTGVHRHPTPRFVYVLAGRVTVEVEGKASHTFKAGEGFQELPNDAHNFRNASATEPAKALGFQIAGRGEPLQY
jgi:quercetin dioxygenase-like cupin family protein